MDPTVRLTAEGGIEHPWFCPYRRPSALPTTTSPNEAVVQFLFEKMSLAREKRRQGLGFLSTNSSSPYSDQPVKQHASQTTGKHWQHESIL
jgi:hypothetical protein